MNSATLASTLTAGPINLPQENDPMDQPIIRIPLKPNYQISYRKKDPDKMPPYNSSEPIESAKINLMSGTGSFMFFAGTSLCRDVILSNIAAAPSILSGGLPNSYEINGKPVNGDEFCRRFGIEGGPRTLEKIYIDNLFEN
jgi:hypothetical protein